MDPTLLYHILTLILTLYGDSNQPRKIVQDVIDYVDSFIRNAYLPLLRGEVIAALKRNDVSDATLEAVDECFQKYNSVFDDVSTETKRFHLLRKKGFIEHEVFDIGTTFVDKIVGNDLLFVPESLYAIHVPLRKTLKLFLELPGMFKQISEYVRVLGKESHVISNIMQADLWLQKYSESADCLVLPLFLFYDDLETGNALGSHAGINKFGAVYAFLACLPPYIASRLSSIFFTNLVYTADKKNSTNEKFFRKIIEEMNFLKSTGINIKVDGVLRLVKFQLALILGDNLGLNSIFGLVESFRANYCCRICKVSSQESAKLTVEDESKLRTRENYGKDVVEKDVSKSGIKESCTFNKVTDFHIAQNLSLDMMHDLLEGVCVYVMGAIIKKLIFKYKYFTLEYLNGRIQNFDYGPTESSNKPQIITINRLKMKFNLKMSASEMLCLVRYFGLMIGDLVPEDNECWQLYKYLRQIIDIVTSPRIIRSDAKVLKKIIKNHHKLYLKLFGGLKPKFHNLLHYPRVLLQNGPCINFWCMRFESRHRELKSNAQSTSCTKNLLKTIAIKQTLKMCEMFHGVERGNVIFSGRDDPVPRSFIFDVQTANQAVSFRQVEVDGTIYKAGTFVVTDMQNSENEFGEIMKIIKADDDIWFEIKIFEEITFDEHYHAYIVKRKDNGTKLLKNTDLPSIAPCLSVNMRNTHFIATRYGL